MVLTIKDANEITSELPLDIIQIIFKYLVQFNLSSASQVCQLIGANHDLDYSIALVLSETKLVLNQSFESYHVVFSSSLNYEDYIKLTKFMIPRGVKFKKLETSLYGRKPVKEPIQFLNDCCKSVSIVEFWGNDIVPHLEVLQIADFIGTSMDFSFDNLSLCPRMKTVALNVDFFNQNYQTKFIDAIKKLKDWAKSESPDESGSGSPKRFQLIISGFEQFQNLHR
ncbi:unnamed protein product [Ambrosiozyma monospora]|uniref:Unnamed protein product n=1 Tax=Ambrosiozyma monospora TaxID=43982 RepID=A0ACB5SYF2_AMBMO|nr:unnamed protein product [Ambrosiozyma monospora]